MFSVWHNESGKNQLNFDNVFIIRMANCSKFLYADFHYRYLTRLRNRFELRDSFQWLSIPGDQFFMVLSRSLRVSLDLLQTDR